VLYLERMVPALRPAANHCAALCLLAKSNRNIQTNIKLRERRRELDDLDAAKHRADLLAAAEVENQTAAEVQACDAEEIVFQLCDRRSRAEAAGAAAMNVP